MDQKEANEKIRSILKEISKVVVGKDYEKKLLLIALLSEGHVLIEGHIGTGKTTLARTFAQVIGMEFKRVQMMPDMLPSDIIGFYMYSLDGSSKLIKGPVFTNILLADELNRASPRTQAALLEAMQEGRVSIEGQTFELPKPFMVIATQIPYGGAGTYPLPETQLDRFMFRCWSDLPSPEEEISIIDNIDLIEEFRTEPVITPNEVLEIISLTKRVYVSDAVKNYIIEIINRIRQNSDVLSGPSPRGSISLYKGSRALALINGRDYVIPDDIKELTIPALIHRIRLKPEAETEGIKPEDIIERALKEVPVPKAGLKT
ncbi:MAG: AAA family ATPase [Candidatus Baldrarchaeia archaeon]